MAERGDSGASARGSDREGVEAAGLDPAARGGRVPSPESSPGELLLEVRAEEIPARMLPGAIQELGTRVFEELMARGLAPASLDGAFTPRRLVLILRGLPARERDRSEEILGPPLKNALDAEGRPTAAVAAFAK